MLATDLQPSKLAEYLISKGFEGSDLASEIKPSKLAQFLIQQGFDPSEIIQWGKIGRFFSV